MDDSLTVFRLNYPEPVIPRTGWLYRFFGARRIFQELIRTHNRPDLIHANMYSSSDLAYLLGKTFHCPAVLSEHASVYPRNLLSGAQLSYYRYFMNKLGLIMPVSVDLQHHMEKAGFRGPYKVIPNAVDTTLFHPATSIPSTGEQPLIILHVAMLQPIKGSAYLLEAFAVLKKKNISCVLWIVGDGPERQRLQELADKLEITPSVSFLGIRNKDAIADLMRQADVFALTSLWENQPVALIEAMASGLPVIAPAIGGIPETVRPENGLLFEPGNVDNLVEKLSEMIAHISDFSPARSAKYAAGFIRNAGNRKTIRRCLPANAHESPLATGIQSYPYEAGSLHRILLPATWRSRCPTNIKIREVSSRIWLECECPDCSPSPQRFDRYHASQRGTI